MQFLSMRACVSYHNFARIMQMHGKMLINNITEIAAVVLFPFAKRARLNTRQIYFDNRLNHTRYIQCVGEVVFDQSEMSGLTTFSSGITARRNY